jgi:DNA mismatch repair protein MutS
VGVVDRVFTRVGASDRLARGESTFMSRGGRRRILAMLRTQPGDPRRSGAGRVLFDGFSPRPKAIAEYLRTPALAAHPVRTHYHELADLAHARAGNAPFEVRVGGDVTPAACCGAANRSYGQVARLAGLPEQ